MGYYAKKLSGERLRECYDIAPPRVRRYLHAEIAHVLSRIRPDDAVLELGCGYGRVALELANVARRVVGVDYESTRGGVIVCKDGFRAGIMTAAGFSEPCSRLGLTPVITEVDESSVFCEVLVPGAA